MAKMYVTRRAVFTTANYKVVNLHDDTIENRSAKLMGFYPSCNDALDEITALFRENSDFKPIVVMDMSYTVETMGQTADTWIANCEHLKSETISSEDAAMFGKRVSSEN